MYVADNLVGFRTLRAGGWAHSAGGMEIKDKAPAPQRLGGNFGGG